MAQMRRSRPRARSGPLQCPLLCRGRDHAERVGGDDGVGEPDERVTYSNGARKAVYRDPDGNELGLGGAPL